MVHNPQDRGCLRNQEHLTDVNPTNRLLKMSLSDTDTICAIATSPGRSGIGIVRISGPSCQSIAERVLGFPPSPRHAYFTDFRAESTEVIDKGIALFFNAPHSFTGEDVLELQGHGGYFVLNRLLKAIVGLGARIARPGEFSERAFLNDKMDLAQVEALADLIDASSEQAAKFALRTLDGELSRLVHGLLERIVEIRVYLEASIDFVDEDIDFLSAGGIREKLLGTRNALEDIFRQARTGAILREGVHVAIAGKPNAGKSSLLNALSGRDSAIVTEIPGTTRDILKESIEIDGLPLHVVDTAGLRDSSDIVEMEGIRRARSALEQADMVLLVLDYQLARPDDGYATRLFRETRLPESVLATGKLLAVFNKIDLAPPLEPPAVIKISHQPVPAVWVSAKTGQGLQYLRERLKAAVGFKTEEGSFIARQRHIDALQRTGRLLDCALDGLDSGASLELVAEDLRVAQDRLGEITGAYTTDNLLGEIFSSFCIGK